MTRTRFGLLLALLALAVAAASFATGLVILDDDEPDPPPAAVDSGDSLAPDADPGTSTTGAPDAPSSGQWIVVIASEEDEAKAAASAAKVTAAGHPADVLRSDDYPSLNPGFWVAFAGPYPDRPAAEAAVGDLEADGISGTYARCAGPEDACAG